MKDLRMTQSDKAAVAAEEAPQARTPLIDPMTVVGWGIDADPQNDPTWPMRDRTEDDGPGANWIAPETQAVDVEILQSVEYLRRPAVVGTTVPPSGLSGVMRRLAFRFSEGQWGHWLVLMAADRVNVVEGALTDVIRGRSPNPFGERGLVKRNQAAQATAVTLVAVGLAAVGAVYLARRRR